MNTISLNLWRAFFLSLSFFLLGCDSGFLGFSSESDQSKLESRLNVYKPRLEYLRGLKYKRPIHAGIITREAFQKQINAEIDGDISDSLSNEISLEFRHLGFFNDSTTQFKSLVKQNLGGFPAAYYVPGKDSLYVFSEYLGNEEALAQILPHELVHALQDQNFDYLRSQSKGNPAYLDTDRNSFKKLVVEGDAEYTNMLYYSTWIQNAQNPSEYVSYLVTVNRNSLFSNWTKNQPPMTLFSTMLAPYSIGPNFIHQTKNTFGVQGINQLFQESGRLAIDAYINANVTPVIHDFALVFNLIDTVNQFTDYGNLGSEGLMGLLGPYLTQEDFDQALGWRGDRFVYVHPQNKKYGKIVATFSLSSPYWAKRLYSILSDHLFNRGIPKLARLEDSANATQNDFTESIAYGAPDFSGILGYSGNDCYWIENAEPNNHALILDLKGSKALAKTGKINQAENAPSSSLSYLNPPWPKGYILVSSDGKSF